MLTAPGKDHLGETICGCARFRDLGFPKPHLWVDWVYGCSRRAANPVVVQ